MNAYIEQKVLEYFSQKEYNDKNISVSLIRTELFHLIGQNPTINITYKKEKFLNESTNEMVELDQIEYLEVLYIEEEPIWNGHTMSAPKVGKLKIQI